MAETAQCPPGPPATILVYVDQDLLGDGLLKLPFARALRAAFPNARVSWAPGKGGSVYTGVLKPLVEGLIDEVIEDTGIGSRLSDVFRRPLRGRVFDLVLDTQRIAATTLSVRRVAHRRFISGSAGYLFSDVRPAGVTPWSYRKPAAVIDQWLEMVTLAAGAARARDIAGVDLWTVKVPPGAARRAAALLPEGPRQVAIAPGAGNRRKCWPLDRFIELGRRLEARGLVPVYMLGPREGAWEGTLRDAVPGARFPLSGAARGDSGDPMLTVALAARCEACVANDSGGGHLMAAAGKPMVVLFGPTSAAKFAPRAPGVSVIDAKQFGADSMSAIPIGAVEDGLMALLEN